MRTSRQIPISSQLAAPGEAGSTKAAAAEVIPAHAASLRCLGMGIVRGVDMAQQLLYLLTPLSQAHLERVTRLQVGIACYVHSAQHSTSRMLAECLLGQMQFL